MPSDPRLGAPLSEAEVEEALGQGIALFDAGAFWEAHEAWETGWHRAPPTERDLFQGLIHAAAACLHHSRGNGWGLHRQRERMRRRLGRFGSRHRGIDLARLVAAVEALEAGVDAAYPRLGP